VLLFKVDTTVGLVGAIVCLLAVPFLMAVAVNLWPNTPIARLLTLKHRQKAQTNTDETAPAADQKLVGKTGKALTDLRPVGTCLIDGQRTECLAESGIIRAGAAVRVVLVDGLQIKVREES
jgi:membrane-bound ClpP family serine protease